MANCSVQSSTASSPAYRPSQRCATTTSPQQLPGSLAAAQTGLFRHLSLDCSAAPLPLPLTLSLNMPPSPLSSRGAGASRQLFGQPSAPASATASASSSSSSMLFACAGAGAGAGAGVSSGTGAGLAPHNSPSVAASASSMFGAMPGSGYAAGAASCTTAPGGLGHGQQQDMQTVTHQELLRYLKDRQTAAHLAQQQRLAQHGQHHQLVQQPGASRKSSMSSIFGNLSTLPPPLSYPTLPSTVSFDFSSPPSPRSPSERAAHSHGPAVSSCHSHSSTSIFSSASSKSLLCPSPSSSLSSSSYQSVEDVVEHDIDYLADHFNLPMQLLTPTLLTHRMLHNMGMDAAGGSPARLANGGSHPLSHQLPVLPLMVDDIPALPMSGDMPPGSLQWQQEMERHELWSQTAQQQLVMARQHQPLTEQRRPKQQQQRYSDSEEEEEDDGHDKDGERGGNNVDDATSESDSDAAGAGVRVSGSSSSSSSSSDDSDAPRAGSNSGRRVKRRRNSHSGKRKSASEHDEDDSDDSSNDDNGKSTCGKHAPKRSSKRSGKGSRSKRSKKRRRNQRKEQHSDDSESEQEDNAEDVEDDDDDDKERLERGKAGKRPAGRAMASENSSLSPKSSSSASPFYSPSPSSFSTSTAGSYSSSSKSASALGHDNASPLLPLRLVPHRRPGRRAGGHRSKLPAPVVAVLRSFFLHHISHPFPTELEKRELVSRTGLSMKQVCDWFTNNRKRYWKPYERKMEKIGCALVGPTYRRAQQTAGRGGKKERKVGRSRGGAQRQQQHEDDDDDYDEEDGGLTSFDKDKQLRSNCRCGEDGVRIHDWRQMWD